jgi:hypothetical protein
MPKLAVIVFTLCSLSCIGATPGPQGSGGRTAIVDLSSGSNHALLIGGWDGTRWVKHEDFHRVVRGGERYRLYGFAAKVGEASGGKAMLSEASGSAWQIELKNPPRADEDTIGLTGSWSPFPRKARRVKDVAAYHAPVASAMKRKGLLDAPVLITGAVRVDLDGDGAEEEIVSATSPRLARDAGEALAHAEKGDCSFVLVRSRLHGRSVSTVLEGAYWYSRDATSVVNEIGGVMDLNGDGKIEIIVRSHYFEGGGARIYELRSGRPVEALSVVDGA